MKKVILLVSRLDQEIALKRLRKMGVVHINIPQNIISEDITHLEEILHQAEKALQLIPTVEEAEKPTKESAPDIIDNILEIEELQTVLNQRLAELNEMEAWYKQWGKISLEDVKNLEKSGLYLMLYSTSRTALQEISEDAWVFEIGGDKHSVLLAFVTDDEKEKLPFKEEHLPTMEWKEIHEEHNETEKKLKTLSEKIYRYTGDVDKIKSYIKTVTKDLTLAKVRDSMAVEGPVILLQGFIPEDKSDVIKKGADKYGWGYVLDDPSEEDNPPTLVKTPKWVGVIKPIFDFMGTVPGYREYDISLWFLIFFSLFFAMLIGDAGYGLLFIVLTALARRKMKKAPPEPFRLMYLLGGATVVWGVISGTWFGSEAFVTIPFFRKFIIPELSSFDLNNPSSFNDNQTFMMSICFLIGAIHLTIAHLINAWKLQKSLNVFGQLGWVMIIWGIFFLARQLVLNKPMPSISLWILIVGFVLALFFSNTEKGIIKGALGSLGNLPLDIISGFSDVVSYLRLFAVGYASIVVSYSFNHMAIGSGINNVLSGLIAAFILFFGHGLNIVLGAMSIIVHGIRLNMLEFSGHLGMEWAGIPYKPFSESES
ncbi:MAG: V-type ATPase 116kDa subunit family protein [Candidatus Marinimicrobia bacterium]|nr:V-type ATPase 116kDa subunit family protein [Candidatus Neomarinimicrobiota bacterium]